jgi:hypothetical protein
VLFVTKNAAIGRRQHVGVGQSHTGRRRRQSQPRDHVPDPEHDNRNGDSGCTWDCWKPVVRDTSTRPSDGVTLRCLAAHPNVRSVSLDQGGLLAENIFGERFRLTPVSVERTLAFHASILPS